MKILVILGGTLGSGDLAVAYKENATGLLQRGVDNKETPFARHEISVVLAEEAINAYFNYVPDRIIFLGTYVETGKDTPAFVLAQRMLTRNADKKKFLFANPLRVPPFGNEENFFAMTDTAGMTNWLGL